MMCVCVCVSITSVIPVRNTSHYVVIQNNTNKTVPELEQLEQHLSAECQQKIVNLIIVLFIVRLLYWIT